MVMHQMTVLFCFVIFVINVGVNATPTSLSGNYTFSGVFAFHSSDGTAKQDCGEIDTQNAILYFEAFRYAINYVNNLSISNYKIGYYAFDTCDSSRKLKIITKDQCEQQVGRAIMALVGPSSSDAALEMSTIFNIWGINSISYSAASPLFDDRSQHTKFLRTVPSDSYQISAVIDIIRHFNWTYVFALSSCSNFEQKVLNTFDERMLADKRCLARKSTLPCVRTDESYRRELSVLLKDNKARVVVLFTSKDDTIGLLKMAKKLNVPKGRFTWLGSTGWGNLDLKTYGLEDIARGAFTLVYPPTVAPPEDFKRHFFSLNPSNNNYSYFIEYWEAIFNCSVPGNPNSKGRRLCSGMEKLQDGVGWYPFTNVQPVFDAVMAAFRGFYSLVPTCPFSPSLCRLHAVLESSKIVSTLEGTTYESLPAGHNKTFDSRGGFNGRYYILNFASSAGINAYRRVGSWEAYDNVTTNGKLSMNDHLIDWPSQGKVQVSICSEPCSQAKGEIRKPSTNERLKFCCWICSKCAYNQIIVNNTCVFCDELQMPNSARDVCVKLPKETVRFLDSFGITILCLSLLGFLGTTFVVFLFAYFYSSAIVKASGRESSFLMLIGIYLCFISPIVFLSEPTVACCGVQRFIAGLSFSVIYAPLFLKTNRIFRIFQSAKATTARPSLISPLSQIMISLGIILLQVLLGVVWIFGDPPTVQRVFPQTKHKYLLFCKSNPYTMVLNLLVCLAIMIACTYYAFRTRSFPKNYNETKTIMYTLYFSCFAWGIFFPTYLLSDDAESFLRTYTIAVFCDAIGFISLIGFFGPKVHLILRKPTVADGQTIGNNMLSQFPGTTTRKENIRVVVVEENDDQLQNSSGFLANKGARMDVVTQMSDVQSSNGD